MPGRSQMGGKAIRYRPEIDGLRALAVLPVILFHGGIAGFAGGFVGVDVFFVISGYLITGIILAELAEGRFSIARFYERRARRILPALFFVMLVCLPFAWAWMLPGQFKDFSQAVAATALFASNVLFWHKTDYFAPAAEENPLLHTWSLAVEEQFYIVFPILLLLLWRFGRAPAFWTIVGLSLVSLAFAEWASRHAPAANFYLIFSRAWELGIGALCALVTFRRPARPSGTLAAVGLGMIVAAVFLFDDTTPFPSLYALLPVIGTALVILFAGAETLAGRLLSLRWIVGLGLVSYSAYLWHQPLFAFARIRSPIEPSTGQILMLAALSVGLAYVSWRFVEQPFRRRDLPGLRMPVAVFSASAIGLAAFVALGLQGHLREGVPDRMPEIVHAIEEQSRNRSPWREACYHTEGLPELPTEDCLVDRGGFTFAVLGDSHVDAAFAQLVRETEGDRISLYKASYMGCPPLARVRRADFPVGHQCAAFNDDVAALIEQGAFDGIVLIARWPAYVEEALFDNGEGGIEPGSRPRMMPPAGRGPAPGHGDAWFTEEVRRSIERAARHVPVILVYPVPEAGWHVPHMAARLALNARVDSLPEVTTDRAVIEERKGRAVALLDAIEGDNVWRVRPKEFFCPPELEGRCLNTTAYEVLYSDHDHVTDAGAALFTPAIRAAMHAIVRSKDGADFTN